MEKEAQKLKMVVGRRGSCTPPPTWRFESTNKELITLHTTTIDGVSARKLCANLWETRPYYHHARGSKMCARFSRRKYNGSMEQSTSDSTLRKHEVPSLVHPLCSVEINEHDLQPVSPAAYNNSLEVAPYEPEATTISYKDMVGESRYSLKSSTELVKVLNRIQSLKEQHVHDVSLVEALKVKLHQSKLRAKELLREKQIDRQELDELLEQVEDLKLHKKHQEQDRVKAVVLSVREELEDERKLKKHSESLQLKLAQELSMVNSSFSDAVKELNQERKTRFSLEHLCDEFAVGIRQYEEKVKLMKQKFEKDRIGDENPNLLVFNISEAWLDERMQMKQNDIAQRNALLDTEIETSLQANHSVKLRKNGNLSRNELPETNSPQHSSELFPLNKAVTARWGAANKEDPACLLGERYKEDFWVQSIIRGHVSPVHQWMPISAALDTEKSLKCHHQGLVKHKTLKEKLLEARAESRHFRAINQ